MEKVGKKQKSMVNPTAKDFEKRAKEMGKEVGGVLAAKESTVFQENGTLDIALRRAFWKKGVSLVDRIKIRKWLRDTLAREEIEYSLTQFAIDSGAIDAEKKKVVSSTGIFVGNYITDLLEWILENWDSILEIIMTIINLFSGEESE